MIMQINRSLKNNNTTNKPDLAPKSSHNISSAHKTVSTFMTHSRGVNDFGLLFIDS